MPFGVDPKTVLCQYYKQGNCEKGRKCKFSHDLAVERKGEKRNLYQDSRDAEKEREEEERKKDDMVDWDEGTHHLSFHSILAILSWGILDRYSISDTKQQQNSARSSSANTATPKPRRTKYANTSSKRSKTVNTAGSGPVRTEATSACTSIVYRQGTSSSMPSTTPPMGYMPCIASTFPFRLYPILTASEYPILTASEIL